MRTNKEERYIPVPRLSDTRYVASTIRYPLLNLDYQILVTQRNGQKEMEI